MKHVLRMALVGLVLTCGIFAASGNHAAAAQPETSHAHANLLGWLHAVSTVENMVVKVGNQLTDVGSSPTYAKALVHIRHAERLIVNAIRAYVAAPHPPARYSATNVLLGRSLHEYKMGLAIVDQGFAGHKNKVIRRGLKIVTRGSADQNRVAAQLKNVH